MRVPGCKGFLEKQITWREISLRGRRVVIDGQNFFYEKYKESQLEDQFGCECDKYSEFLRGKLQALRRAGVTCLFVFKGAHGASPRPSHIYNDRPVEPLLSREVYRQLLDEMGFDYTVCEYTVKDDCVALARSLQCPILANNVEYFFSGVQYIPFTTLDYSSLKARQYELNSLLIKYKIDKKQVAIFLALFDLTVFSLETLENLLKKLNLTPQYNKRMDNFLCWLGREGERATELISCNLAAEEGLKLQAETERKLVNIIEKRTAGGLAAQYFLNRDRCRIHEGDPDWFEKGVIFKFIPIPYIKIYHSRIIESMCKNHNAEDFFLVAAPIIRYAFDLFTNFSDEKLFFKSERRELQRSGDENDSWASIKVVPTVRRPNYGAGNVFENGWDDIDSFKLFEHFLSETVGISEWGRLERAPDGAKLLLVALVYAARRGRSGPAAQAAAHAALLCHTLLAAPPDSPALLQLKDTHVSALDEEEQSVLQPVRQLQHCLRHINFLNIMCGSPLPPTRYRRTFNATFVDRAARSARGAWATGGAGGARPPAPALPPALRSYLDNIVDIYQHFVNIQ